MTAIQLLTQQLKEAHNIFLGTLDQVTNDVANKQPEGKALSVAAAWVHLVESEDVFLAAISGQQPISAGLASQTGVSSSQPIENFTEAFPAWAKEVTVDVEPLMAYTKAVFSASEAFVSSLNDSDLETTHDMGSMGQATTTTVVSGYIIAHCFSLTGEISAIKGTHGLKGYPF